MAAEQAIKAAREASAYLEKLDRASLYHAAAHRDNDWLIREQSEALVSGLQGPDSEARYGILAPQFGPKPLQLSEVQQVTRELVEGIYVFNQTPSLSFEPLCDCTSHNNLPSAYHDTLVGEAMFSVAYFVSSLLQGTTVQQKDRRVRLSENFHQLGVQGVRKAFQEEGLVEMEADQELGRDLYLERKEPILRYPPRYIDTDIMRGDFEENPPQHNRDHVTRDVFLQYVGVVDMNVVFGQCRLLQEGAVLVLEPTLDLTTSVRSREDNAELLSHLHTYLQKQRKLVADNLTKKVDVAHYIDLLHLVSFLIPFLITLKRQNKIVDVSSLNTSFPKDLLRTERELPPAFPGKASRWAPYSEEHFTGTRGGVFFHKAHKTVRTPLGSSFREVLSMPLSPNSLDSVSLEGRQYNVFVVRVEDYYPKSPKVPRWVHAMISELKTQCGRLLPMNESRVQDLLRKPLGSRHAAQLKTVNVLLPACVEQGLLSAVVSLLRLCTTTRLNKVNERGWALVHQAAFNCRADVLSTLLNAGCSPVHKIHTPDGVEMKTEPIHLAALCGGLDAVCCLLQHGAQPSVVDDRGWTPLHYAASNNDQVLATHLIGIDPAGIETETSDKVRATPLLLAVMNGGFDTMVSLIKLGANIHAVDGSGRGIVHIAALRHHVDILKHLIEFESPSCPVWEIYAKMLASSSEGHPRAAALALDSITRWKPACSSDLLRHDAVASLIGLLREEEEIQQFSIQVLANLSNVEQVKEFLSKADIIPQLMVLLASRNERIQQSACVVLGDLGTASSNQEAAIKAGAIPLLTKLLSGGNQKVQLFAAACIGILSCGSAEGQSAVNQCSTIPALLSLLECPLDSLQATACCVLQLVLDGNKENQIACLSANVHIPLIHLLQSKETVVHCNAAQAIAALAENNIVCQKKLTTDIACIGHLTRLLRMIEPQVKVAGSCALWALAGSRISGKRFIAKQIGVDLLIDMLSTHYEQLNFVCSEALCVFASQLGDNQSFISSNGGIRPLVDVLTLPTSERLLLSVLHTLAALVVKPGLVPNPKLQKTIATVRGITVLAAVIASDAPETVRVEAACTLAKVIIENPENDLYLKESTNFSYLLIYKFFTSSDPIVRLLAGYCLSIMVFNNPAKLEELSCLGTISISNFSFFLDNEDEFFKSHASFQIVVLAKLLSGIQPVRAKVQGIQVIVDLLSSQREKTKVLCCEFVATLSRSTSSGGIPDTLVMAGALDPLVANLVSDNEPVIEGTCVALGYLTFNTTAARLLLSVFRDRPHLFQVFRDYLSVIVVSKKFLQSWEIAQRSGLPSLR